MRVKKGTKDTKGVESIVSNRQDESRDSIALVESKQQEGIDVRGLSGLAWDDCPPQVLPVESVVSTPAPSATSKGRKRSNVVEPVDKAKPSSKQV